MKLYLIRHGRTPYNAEARYQGRRDIPLSVSGEAELRRAEQLRPAVVWTSPMRRARRTAELLFPAARQIPVEDFREMDFGRFEGRNYREMAEDREYRSWVEGGCTAPCPGGESRAEFCTRVCAAFSRLLAAEAARTRELVIVAHGGVQMAVLERFALPRRDYFQWSAPCGCGYLLEVDRSRAGDSGWLRLVKQVCCTGEGGLC